MRRPVFALAALAALAAPAVFAACSDSGPPLSSATSLQCPTPGALPFALASSGFQKASNATLATDNPRVKDEGSDTLGNPGGPLATIYFADTQPPATAVDYRGAKARTTPTGGLFGKPLVGETVSLWFYDTKAARWQSVGRAITQSDGSYDLPATGFVAPNGQPIYAVLEADGSCAEHFDYLLPPGSSVVVSDIDATLTLDDAQIIDQATMAMYTPKVMPGADRLTQAWAAKGYPVVYLTARSHNLRTETRSWLRDLGFATGPLVTFGGGSEGADVYKTVWLDRMVKDFQWKIVAAYGNADTDITAYNNAGIPKAQTFIVGPLAGSMGTQPIANMDFTAHIAAYVTAQPNNP